MFPQKILTLNSWEIYTENSFVSLRFVIPKEISDTSIPNPKYILIKGNRKFKGPSL